MHFYRTRFEAIIEAQIDEIRSLGRELANMENGNTRVYFSSPAARETQGAESGHKLVVTASNSKFLAEWKSGTGLIIHGNPDSLKAFADAFDFKCEPIPGTHTHWETFGDNAIIHDASIPIVVQLT